MCPMDRCLGYNFRYYPFESHIHYANMSMQCIVIFHGCINDNFQMKNCKIVIFFIFFAQNIDCGYTLHEYPQSMF